MGQGKRRFFTPEFKAQAARLVIKGKPPISQIAGDLRIGESLLRRWRREHEEHAAPAPSRPLATANKISLEEEVRRLRRENECLRQEREIIKKLGRQAWLTGEAFEVCEVGVLVAAKARPASAGLGVVLPEPSGA